MKLYLFGLSVSNKRRYFTPVEFSHVNLMHCMFVDAGAFGNRLFAMTIQHQLLELLLCIINHDHAK